MIDGQRRFVVLDRDGVINHESDDFIKTPDEWIPLQGSLDAIATLCRGGFRISVATNQSGVGRGLYTLEVLAEIHQKMLRSINDAGGTIDEIFFCPHLPDAGCSCRKPQPGMLYQAAEAFGCDPASMTVIGDSMRDLEAAAAVGAASILVRTGYGRRTETLLADDGATPVFDDLAAAARELIRSRRQC